MSTKPTIVLVHGSWHSPTAMAPVANNLKAKGYDSVCPSLPTMGDNQSHDFKDKTCYDDAQLIRDTVSSLVSDGKEVLVVAHSYGGQVTSEAIREEMGKSARSKQGRNGGVIGLFYICAFLLPEGVVGLSWFLLPQFSPPTFVVPHPLKGYSTVHNGAHYFYNDLEPAAQDYWVGELRLATLTGHAKPTTYAAQRYFPTTYMHTSLDKTCEPALQQYMIQKNKEAGITGIREVTCEAGHSPFLSMPDKVVDEILVAIEHSQQHSALSQTPQRCFSASAPCQSYSTAAHLDPPTPAASPQRRYPPPPPLQPSPPPAHPHPSTDSADPSPAPDPVVVGRERNRMTSSLKMATGALRPIRLFLDFDGTITRKDTMNLVARIGYRAQERKRDGQSQEFPPWEHFVDTYMADYSDHVSRYRPVKEDRSTVEQEIMYLRSFRPIEDASMSRVVASGLFKDVAASHIESFAQECLRQQDDAHWQVSRRPGLHKLLKSLQVRQEQAMSQQPICHVISVNWSRIWIQAMLELGGDGCPPLLTTDGKTKSNIRIYANELSKTDKESGTSDLTGTTINCKTGEDKVKQMRCVIEEGNREQNCALNIYVGDSATDLECLLEADIGICIRDDPMGSGQKDLAEICGRVGLQVAHISDASDPDKATARILYWARDYHEVLVWIKSLR
ncbi:hypothetical protein FH972_024440 [Carpinus fangiana]|uniref:AB hydrolase-1 domain-containing protein n=1 Tax=Carpinus fangiana TaxID=176857 RepID=A0A5N6L0J6_9ROSI|nr:hypothetical protein FH972_024440 [Carpinus fangiana]